MTINYGALRVRNTLLYLLCFCSIILAAPFFVRSAQALETLIYSQKTSRSSTIQIHKYIASQSNINSNIEIAPIDLNDDGLNEFVVKDPACALDHGFCRFYVLAENDAEIISIGYIEAKNLAVDTKNSNGIRNLLAFETPSNDYARTLYVWDAVRSRYILAE